MLIKITTQCSMGCTHCLSDCKPIGKHMDFNTFIDSINFNNRAGNSPITISGGEPTEHPEFINFIGYLSSLSKDTIINITTNGLWLSKNEKFIEDCLNRIPNLTFQVVIDDRYYPIHVNENILNKYKNVIVCYQVQSIYPQGRALKNNLPWTRKSSNCFNVRALAKQINNVTLKDIIMNQISRMHFCTPHIDINGNIKLGESDLCPICSNIYKEDKEIIKDIINFKCYQCDFINKNLPPIYRQFVE